MGEEDVISGKPEPVANGNIEVEKKTEVEEKTAAMLDKKGDQHGGVTEMEEDKSDEGKVEAQQMDIDKEDPKESKEIKKLEENVAREGEKKEQDMTEPDKEKQDTAGEDRGKEEAKSEEMDEGTEEKTKKDTKGEADGVKEEDETPDKPKEEKVSKKRPRLKIKAGKYNIDKKEPVEKEIEQGPPTSVEKKTEEPKTPLEKKTKEPKTSAKKKKKETKTPVASTSARPVRERKSVERLVATIEKDSAKDFHIEKGRGTALKDIPNVFYKLSRKKNEDTFKLLHTILFGRRGKAAQLKNNISRFSGFVWHDNEEKQMIKLKENLDKCAKEKLVEICDILDLPISKANPRKEDIIANLIEFLVEPHATTSDLLADKEQGKKRKRVVKSASEGTPSKGSAKSRKKADSETKKSEDTKSVLVNTPPESEDESEEKEEDVNGSSERIDDEMSEKAESEENEVESEQESDEEKEKQKRGSIKSSAKKGSSEKAITKKVTISKKTSPPTKKAPVKLPLSSKGEDNTSSKKSSDQKKEEPATKKSLDKKKEEPIIKKLSDKKKEEPITKKSSVKKKEEPITKKSTDKKKEEPITKKSSDKKKQESIAKKSSEKKEEPVTKKSSDKKKQEPIAKKSSEKKEEPVTKKSSDKKTEEPPINKSAAPKKSSTPNKPVPKESTGNKVLEVKDTPKEVTSKPSDDDLRNSICKILKEVDFNTATFSDILKLVDKQFNTDLTTKKASLKRMIEDELMKLADAEGTDDEEDNDDAGKEEKITLMSV